MGGRGKGKKERKGGRERDRWTERLALSADQFIKMPLGNYSVKSSVHRGILPEDPMSARKK